MKRYIVVMFFLFAVCPINAEAANSDALIGKIALPIAVEKITGRGESYETEFSGIVGSIRIYPELKIIVIADLMEHEGEISITSSIFQITSTEVFDNSFNFECVGIDFGIEWSGKAWLREDTKPMIEMVQKSSPRKWVNLGEHGNRFLKEKNLGKIDLGQ